MPVAVFPDCSLWKNRTDLSHSEPDRPMQTTNVAAISLYERMGFTRDKRLHRYYMSNQDAFRLKLRLPHPAAPEARPDGLVSAVQELTV